jgi:hypothetical protein
MKFAYADPPYIGQAEKHYSHDPNCAEVDHQELIARMEREYDAWALSMSEPTRYDIETMCHELGAVPYRVGIWVKPFASFKPNVNPAYAFEPVIFRGGRKRGRDLPTVRDWIAESITLEKGLSGAKPPKFCYWLFDMLGAQPGDEFTDLFPGTGIVTRAWENFTQRGRTHDLPLFAQVEP